MCGTMNVQVEVWCVAADDQGIWLTNGAGGAWLSAPIPQDSDPHFEVETLLAEHGVAGRQKLVHSTSWRADGPHVVLTYVAVVDPAAPVVQAYPDALPLGDELLQAVGRPPTNRAADAPLPRYIDVLTHAVRHLRFLLDYDATARAAMPSALAGHLTRLTPALAGLYATQHDQS